MSEIDFYKYTDVFFTKTSIFVNDKILYLCYHQVIKSKNTQNL